MVIESLRWELALPVLGALAAGSLIGVERSFRAHPAGFRTHALVCLGAALLMVASVHQLEWMGPYAGSEVVRIDPVRMAHGILTGIGFLCGGVIFREGFSVHGLTTAASLWVTSALGVLYGIGFYSLALGGTLAALITLAGLRWLDDRLPRRSLVDIAIRYRRDAAFSESELKAVLGEFRLSPMQVSHRLLDEGRVIEHVSTVRGAGRSRTAALADRLCQDARVIEYAIDPRPE